MHIPEDEKICLIGCFGGASPWTRLLEKTAENPCRAVFIPSRRLLQILIIIFTSLLHFPFVPHSTRTKFFC
jgi:hypothetical protein